ncbi:unnamed protein product [Dracunculus medinensis]|uniref:Transthyretin-like family-containing protein n=1 Tax=Dracunculus medinensis TaxID=318479 RepID=A0A0N4UN84_DRAME|nr:unnamed protein product [Dracunculus medinensis]
MKQLIIILIITTMVVAERSKYLNAISTRSTAAKGNFLCGKEAAANVKVQLYSKEGDDDNILATTTSTLNGDFKIEGNTAGKSDQILEPMLKIHHTCNETEKELKKKKERVVTLRYPKDYVTMGQIPRQTYDIGTLNLQVIYPGEKIEKEDNEK